MLKYLLLILINMVNIKGFPYHNIIKQTIIHDINIQKNPIVKIGLYF
jgi:hypothetical protein